MKANTGFNLPLRCTCGQVRGVAINVSPSTGFRFVCYCKDCQAFAHFLERKGVLNQAGGTDRTKAPRAVPRVLTPSERAAL